ncbi:cohesin subunit SA-3 isoform X2 [Microcaecilia unicolor]|uniref:Cohesin subunit SA n=1 Tax=Microcaecilia unicolor TaxID=1415580 RepID=A0A6P7WRP8_9AMPH|nr:cohesin subunit SA-3 isoform X2 [Microcaecilia unicolor]
MPTLRSSRLTKEGSSSSPMRSELPAAFLPEAGSHSAPGSSTSSIIMGDEVELLLGSESPGIKCGSNGSESQSDVGSDFEDTLKKSTKRPAKMAERRAPAPKRPRKAEGKERSRKGPSKVASITQPASDPGFSNLFEAVKTSKSSMQSLVDDWLESYKVDREEGLLELINFFLRSCGCRGVVTQEMLQKLHNAEIIHKMTEEFDEDTPDYPLSMSSPPWKKFRQSFCEFIAALVRQCQYNIVYDEFLMDNLVSLLTGLSDSQVRAFRHTSTLAAMKLMTALVGIALNLSLYKDNNQRQYEAERSKALGKRATERLEVLIGQRREFQEHQEEIENMMNTLFKGVFVHRYRDSIPEIRALCMEEIGIWMKSYSASFLNDSYLKYIGWTLHDKHGDVRLKCLKSLQGLYCHKEMAAKLELFTGRFKDRMVAMVLDKENEVSVEAVKLLTLILQNMEDVLNTEDCENVYPLVYASSRAVASAAGEFLYLKLFELDGRTAAGKERGHRSPGGSFHRLLVAFFIESELHEHAAYLVDSLWDWTGPLLKDWEGMTDLLLEEATDGQEGLGDRQESALTEIMVASMRQAIEGHPPVGRVAGKKASTAKERKVQTEDKMRLTRHMILVLPQLLGKFSADAEKVTALLRVPHFLELETYCTGRLEKYLDLLLRQVCEIVEKHTELDVLEACARVLYILCREEHAFYNRADIVRSQLLDHLVDKFLQEVEELMQTNDPDEDEVYNTSASLKRISVLHNAHDMTRWELFDPCCRLLRKGIDTGEIPKQIMMPALTCAYFFILWKLAQVSSSMPSQEQLSVLKQQQNSFADLCQSCLTDMDLGVREQAFVLLSDLLVIFSYQITKSGRGFLLSLVLKPEPPLQAELASFLMDHIFIELQNDGEEDEVMKIEALHKRRNLLAGYCKLIIYNILDLNSATDIFKHYVKYYNDYGDIIKETLSRARQIDKVQCARTLLLSLQQLYSELEQDVGPFSARTAPEFIEVRDLARRFSLMFGPDLLKSREPVVMLHKDGIKFAFGIAAPRDPEVIPQNLAFLDVLCEFSAKLLKQDKKLLLRYLKTCSDQLSPDQRDKACTLLQAYRRSLGAEEDTGVSILSKASSRESVTHPEKRPAKKRRLDTTSLSEDTSWLKHDESLQLSSRLTTPPFTSTVLKESRKQVPREQSVQEEEGEEEEQESEKGSESEFAPSPSWIGSHRLREDRRLQPATPVGKSHRLQEDRRLQPATPAGDSRRLPDWRLQSTTSAGGSRQNINSELQRLRLMEEEEEGDEDEPVIKENESSEESEDSIMVRRRQLHPKHHPDLFDSAALGSDEDFAD